MGLVEMLVACSMGALVNRVLGPNNTEITHGSAVGGFQVFLRGKDLGTAFNPPSILIGSSGFATCSVHPKAHGGVTRLKGFTSSSTMMKCLVDPQNLPPPPDTYDAAGVFVTLPLYVYKDGKNAACWHVGGTNHGCQLRFDLGGTPRLTGLSTPVVQAGGLFRVTGHGIDGGLKGVAQVEGRLQQDASGAIRMSHGAGGWCPPAAGRPVPLSVA